MILLIKVMNTSPTTSSPVVNDGRIGKNCVKKKCKFDR